MFQTIFQLPICGSHLGTCSVILYDIHRTIRATEIASLINWNNWSASLNYLCVCYSVNGVYEPYSPVQFTVIWSLLVKTMTKRMRSMLSIEGLSKGQKAFVGENACRREEINIIAARPNPCFQKSHVELLALIWPVIAYSHIGVHS